VDFRDHTVLPPRWRQAQLRQAQTRITLVHELRTWLHWPSHQHVQQRTRPSQPSMPSSKHQQTLWQAQTRIDLDH